MNDKKKNLGFAAIAGLALCLAGCSVGPDYRKPDAALPQNWQSSKAATVADENAIEQNWWKNFHDPILDQLVATASAGNFDLKIAEARIAGARATRAVAASTLLPQGDATVSGNRQANRLAFPDASSSPFGTLLSKPFNTYQTGFDASWELDLFGGHRRDVESAEAQMEAQEASRDDILVSLLAEAARTYMDIRQYQGQLALAEETITSDDSSAGIARQRYKVGDTSEVDVSQAEAQLQQAQAQLPYYRNLLAQAEYSMDVLLGAQPGATHALTAQPAPVPVSDKQFVLAAPAAVIANRPDIRVSERKLAAATAQQGVAVAQFFPDISLSGFIGLLNTNAGNLFQASSKSWMVGGNVLWPILSYGKLSANLDAANAQQQEAMATYQKTMISALSDVERSITAYTEQENFRAALAQAVRDNQRTNGIAHQRYKEGLTSFLEVLDAERSLYASQSQLAQAEAQTAQDLIAVYKSLGGGWKQGTAAPHN